MLKIGEFSKLVQVSVPTLRFYDQLELLKPIHIDRDTGYRYYSVRQLPRLHRILALKGLGFSLEQIREVLDQGLSPEQMRGMLRLRRAQISQQLEQARSQLMEVETLLLRIEQENQLSSYDVVLKHVEPLLVASVRAILPSHSASGSLFGEVYCALGPHAAAALGPDPGANGQTMVLWYDTEHKERDVDGAAAFVLRRPVPPSGRMQVHELPAATMAATVHHGAYDTIGVAQRRFWPGSKPTGIASSGPIARSVSTTACRSGLTIRRISPSCSIRLRSGRDMPEAPYQAQGPIDLPAPAACPAYGWLRRWCAPAQKSRRLLCVAYLLPELGAAATVRRLPVP